MTEVLEYINEYAACLEQAAIWQSTKEPLAPVMDENGKIAEDNYIYEFFCYLTIVRDLMENYEIKFVEGKDKFKYKFPQAAANKSGKPRFEAYKNGKKQFQICAGTKVDGIMSSEENHPDISFQLADATDSPTYTDLIAIMDAKFKEGKNARLPKDEVYKFKVIIDLFLLNNKELKYPIEFVKFKKMLGNALITNARAYSDENDTQLIKLFFIKEVENFFPGERFRILG